MRIGVLTREWPPEVYGGAGVHVEYLVRELRRLAEVDAEQAGTSFFPAQAARDAALAVVFVEMKHDLAVAVRAERVTLARELFAQLLEVVDLTVHDHGDRFVFVEERLVCLRRQIDDRQAPMTERARAICEEAGGVGPAVRDRVGDSLGGRQVGGRARVTREKTGDAAHSVQGSRAVRLLALLGAR